MWAAGEEKPSHWQQRKEAKRMLYEQSTEAAAVLHLRKKKGQYVT